MVKNSNIQNSFYELVKNRNTQPFVDKTDFLIELNSHLNSVHTQFQTVSRFRKTGKTLTAQMIKLYYSKEYNLDEVKEVLNKKSGMMAVSGVSSDFRPIVAGMNEGNERCKLALQMYAYRLAKFIASYYVPLGGHIDAIVFSGGVGENGPTTRKFVCAELQEAFGIKLDNEANYNAKVFMGVDKQLISTPDSKVKVYVIATNEELVIARSAMSFVK